MKLPCVTVCGLYPCFACGYQGKSVFIIYLWGCVGAMFQVIKSYLHYDYIDIIISVYRSELLEVCCRVNGPVLPVWYPNLYKQKMSHVWGPWVSQLYICLHKFKLHRYSWLVLLNIFLLFTKLFKLLQHNAYMQL